MKLIVLWSFYIPPAILGPSRKGLNIGVCVASSSVGLLLDGFHHCVLYLCVGGGKLWGRWLKFISETKVSVVAVVVVV